MVHAAASASWIARRPTGMPGRLPGHTVVYDPTEQRVVHACVGACYASECLPSGAAEEAPASTARPQRWAPARTRIFSAWSQRARAASLDAPNCWPFADASVRGTRPSLLPATSIADGFFCDAGSIINNEPPYPPICGLRMLQVRIRVAVKCLRFGERSPTPRGVRALQKGRPTGTAFALREAWYCVSSVLRHIVCKARRACQA